MIQQLCGDYQEGGKIRVWSMHAKNQSDKIQKKLFENDQRDRGSQLCEYY